MLTKWIFVLMIDGKITETLQQPSEGQCQLYHVRIVPRLRAQGINAIGSCYIRVADI